MVPQEPHEFDALVRLRAGGHLEKVRFRMSEPGDLTATSNANHKR